MELNPFLKTMTVPEREGFAAKCQTSLGHLQNVAYGCAACSPKLAVLVEKNSKRLVTRQELIPGEWKSIWPELARTRRAKAEA